MTLLIPGPSLDRFLTGKSVFSFDYTPQVVVSNLYEDLIQYLYVVFQYKIVSILISVIGIAGFYCSVMSDLNFSQF